MRLNKFVLIALVVQGLSMNTFAQNRDETDAIFNEPAKAEGTQILLGVGELIAAHYAYPGLTSQQKRVVEAQLDLDVAKELPLTEKQRELTIDAILNNGDNFSFESDIGDAEELKSYHARRLERIKSVHLVSKTERKAAIALAETNLAKAREAVLKAAQELGFVSKAIKVVRIGSSVLLVGDVVARIYVWNAMDANPTVSPVATYIQHMLKK